MLGSVHDAEDAMQEVLLRAWKGLPRFEERSSLRSWLYRIATNVCLSTIERRPKRVLPIDYGPSSDPDDDEFERLSESIWIGPYDDAVLGSESAAAGPDARYEQREAVELAFVAALQHLPGNQRAALVLRDVLGFSAEEAAAAMETTTASVTSALQRARKLVDERLPARSQVRTLRTLGDERLAEIAGRYTDALEGGDVDAVLALLDEGATWSMPPTPVWYRGLEEITAFLNEGPMTVRWRHVPTRANGQLAVGCYTFSESSGDFEPYVLDVLTLDEDGMIVAITAFIDGSLFADLGLPERLPA